MFTGIIEEIGVVKEVSHKNNLSILKVKAKKILKGIKKGESIAIEGCCLTVTKILDGVVVFDVMKETLDKTTIGNLKRDDRVNMEAAMQLKSRVNGHIVTGHVDDVGHIRSVKEDENYLEFQISCDKTLMKYIVRKGSICVDGISLTVGQVTKSFFSVYIIPVTKKVTTLGSKVQGDRVNLETDVFAKYVMKDK